MRWRYLSVFWRLCLVTAVGLLILTQEWPVFGDEENQLDAIVGLRHFDFLVWETEAVLAKAESMLANGHTFLSEAERKEVVLTTMGLMRQAQQLDGAITAYYVDPAVTNPDAASAALQAELVQVRAEMAELQPLAEAIVQEQVGMILAEEGFNLAGQPWPPVMMHMTPLPTLLVVSPRDRIERVHQRALLPGLTTPEKEEMETAVTDHLDLSALVVPIGGMGTYPAMIQETSSLNWLAEVTAHEWAHHWMGFHPVGLYYNDPAVRTINETVASMIDVEIRQKVIERFYPELVPPSPPEPAPPDTAVDLPPAFDFQAEMAATRIQVDELLAAGKIEEAEAYMEARRRLFVENGYAIRKLNQAYFAFYGAYASRPGATGSDPTGPMLRDIRDHSPDLRTFMQIIAPIASFEDLETVWQTAVAEE